MTATNCFSLLIFLGFWSEAAAQHQIFGKTIKKGSEEILIGVNVLNLSEHQRNISDLGGNFRIAALSGDTIVFSSAAYQPDTLVVGWPLLDVSYQEGLTPRVARLPTVTVDEMRNYELDSIQRVQDYAFIYNIKHPVKLLNEKRPGDDPGFSFSPIGYFSQSEKQKRRLKQKLKQEDEDEYINAKFSPFRVAQLTKLSGDSLHLFMTRYKPSYKFCRQATSQDMLLYINDKIILFKKGDPVGQPVL
jgi:hypothetical protein